MAAPPTLWSGREATSGLLVSRYGKVVRFLNLFNLLDLIVDRETTNDEWSRHCAGVFCNLDFVCDLRMVVF